EFENDFVAKINPSGTGLIFSTYLSSSQRQYNVFAMVVDSAGNVIVTGSTSASNSAGYHTTKLNPTGTGLVYSVLDVGGSALALDAAQNVYVAAQSTYLPVVQSVVTDRIVRLDAAGQNPMTLSLGDLRSVPWLQIKDMAIGTTNQIYLTGVANSSPRIGPGGSLEINYAVANGFVARLPGAGTQGADIFVPIVLSSSGANSSFYTSELTLTNHGSTDADLLFSYTAAIGTGSGTASDTLPAGKQRIIPDTIAYLRSIGIPIPQSGNQ